MELFRALACLAEPPAAEGERIAELLDLGPLPDHAAWSDVFLFQLYPYASVYLGPEGMLGGEARDRVAGFWRALGESPPAEPDHLTMLLALYAQLAEAEHAATSQDARRRWQHVRQALLQEHLLSWLPFYLARLDEVGDPFYVRWAAVLRQALQAAATERTAPSTLPLHLRAAPGMLDPRKTGGERFVGSLLSPVRSGLILVRDDLVRAAGKLDLGLRAGERTFALRSLLSQDAATTFAWLAAEARRQAGKHDRQKPLAGEIASFWSARAEATAELLDDLQQGVNHAFPPDIRPASVPIRVSDRLPADR